MREKFEGNHPGAAGPKIPGPDGGPMDSVRKPSFNHPADNRSRVEEALPEGGEAASSGQWTAGKISAARTACCSKAPCRAAGAGWLSWQAPGGGQMLCLWTFI